MIQLFAWTILIGSMLMIMALGAAWVSLSRRVKNRKEKVYWTIKKTIKMTKTQIRTYEDACQVQGIEPLKLSHFSFLPEKDRESALAHNQLTVICRVLRGDWVPDWSDYNQRKWYPWFEKSDSGFGFSGTGYAYWSAVTSVGSRLCFPSEEMARYAGKTFESIYNKLMSI